MMSERSNDKYWRGFLGASLVASLLLVLSSPAMADTAYRLDIPAQDLGSALKALSAAANEQLLFSDDVVAGLRSRGLKGEYTADAAVAELLSGTELKAERTASGVFLIRRVGEKSSTQGERPVAEGVRASAVRVAQGEVQEEKGAEKSAEKSQEKDQNSKLQEIVVTGTHIRGAKIAQPSFSITREEIEKAGFNTVENLFEKLPQNFNIVTPLGQPAAELSNNKVASGAGLSRVTAVDLRGLGAESTLTLVRITLLLPTGTARMPSRVSRPSRTGHCLRFWG